MLAMTRYTDLTNRRKSSVIHFFARFFFNSRIDCCQGDSATDEEELANMYVLTRLADFFCRPQLPQPYEENPVDLHHRLDAESTPRGKALIWHQAADQRFLAQSLFWDNDRLEWGSHYWSPGFASFCYRAAAGLYSQTGWSRSAVPVTLNFLSEHYLRYRLIVRHLATEYLNLLDLVKEADTERAIYQGNQISARDDLIDLLVDWRHQPSAELRERIIRLAVSLDIPWDKLPADLRPS